MELFGNVLIVCFIAAELLFTTDGLSTMWRYEPPFPPKIWHHYFPTCGSTKQSPIDIETNLLVGDESLGRFNRSIFDKMSDQMTFINNGRTLLVTLSNGYIIDDTSLLLDPYQAAQFHLHWGKTDIQGSEHTINGKRYFAELHIVHYNTKYENISVAISEPDGLAVCGFFIQDDYPQDNLEFDNILKPLMKNKVNYENDSFVIDHPFTIETLLPHNLDLYYRYQGSLTSPPCSESVTWSVFDEPIRISKEQAEILNSLVFETKRKNNFIMPLHGNFRPVQPLNGRIVSVPTSCS